MSFFPRFVTLLWGALALAGCGGDGFTSSEDEDASPAGTGGQGGTGKPDGGEDGSAATGGTGGSGGSGGSGGVAGSAGAGGSAGPAFDLGTQWVHHFEATGNAHLTGLSLDGVGAMSLCGHFEGTLDFGDESVDSLDGFDVFVARVAPGGEVQWARPAGGAGHQYCGGVAVDGSSRSLFAASAKSMKLGTFEVTDAGFQRAMVGRFDATGSPNMLVPLGGSGSQLARGIASHASAGISMVGEFSGTLDSAGKLVSAASSPATFAVRLFAPPDEWTHAFNAPSGFRCRALDVAIDALDRALVVGEFASQLDLPSGSLASQGDHDGYLVRISPEGVLGTTVTMGGPLSDSTTCVASWGQDIIVAGRFSKSIRVEPLEVSAAPVGNDDIFLAKLDADGKALWLRAFGEGNDQSPVDVAVDSVGNIFLVGTNAGFVNFGGDTLGGGGTEGFVASFDPDGNHRFSFPIEGPDVTPIGVGVDPVSGNVVVGGSFRTRLEVLGEKRPGSTEAGVFLVSISAKPR